MIYKSSMALSSVKDPKTPLRWQWNRQLINENPSSFFNAWISWFSGEFSRCSFQLPYLGGFNPPATPISVLTGRLGRAPTWSHFRWRTESFQTSTEFFGVGMCLIDVATCCDIQYHHKCPMRLKWCKKSGPSTIAYHDGLPKRLHGDWPSCDYDTLDINKDLSKKIWVAKHAKQRSHLNYRLCVHSLKQPSEIPYLQANTTDLNLLA